jgi:DNA-binding SARP family transcriptional activator
MTEVEFCLLGPVLVRSSGAVIPVPGGKLRAALAVLLLNQGRAVSMEILAETLWGAEPPPAARATTRNHMMRLRKALGAEGGRITTQSHGYRILVDASEVDVSLFESRLSTARKAARKESWDIAAGQARDALALWRGEPLADVDSELLTLREVPRLAELRLQALETRISADLHMGRHADLISEIQHLASAHPVREQLHADLMLALYRAGRQAEALAAYQRARDFLVEEIGSEPGTTLREMHQRILAADPALIVSESVTLAETGALVRVAGDAAPAPAAAEVRYSLPPDTVAFTGRSEELDQITAAVTGAAGPSGVVMVGAIDGMPGVGKTALAVHVAHLLSGRFPDRQLFIDLHAHTPGREPLAAEDVLAGLLAASGVDPRFVPRDLDERAAVWRDRMAGQRVLLVLDNADSSAQVAPLLPGGGECVVLVTSRRHLGDLPGAVVPVLLDVLSAARAEEMFTRLAPRAAADPAGVAEVTRLAGFLPLAVSLLARVFARHRSWTLADLAAETRAGLLTLTAEHQSIAAAFEVSYRHLDLARRRFFDLLGLHPGTTIDCYAAAALAGVGPDEAGRLLDSLHGEGLLTETGHRRYGMHDLLRRYARDHASADPDREQALGRLLDYYQYTATVTQERLARQSRPGLSPDMPAALAATPALENAGHALAWARIERDSLLACLDHVTRAGQHARVITLAGGLAELLCRDGPWTEAITRHAIAVQSARHLGDRLGQAGALTYLGEVRRLTGDHLGAAGDLEQALAIYRDLGGLLGQANAICGLADVRRMTSDYQGAAGDLEQALAIYRDLGDLLGQAYALRGLGDVLRLTSDYQGAAGDLEQALAIYRDLGNRRGQANALNNLGNVRRMMGDYPGAARDMEKALAICGEIGDRIGQAGALSNLGEVRRLTGDYLGAAGDLEQALVIYHDIGSRLGEANALSYLGEVRRLTGDYLAAAGDQERALAIYCDLGSRLGQANALNNLGEVRRITGDYQGAAAGLEKALAICREIGYRLGEAVAFRNLGAVRRVAGDYLGAAADLEQSVAIYRDIGDREGQAEVLNEIGTLHRVTGSLVDAKAYHQQALELARAIGNALHEAHALAGVGRCASLAGHATHAEPLLRHAYEIFQRMGAADALSVLAELDALTVQTALTEP